MSSLDDDLDEFDRGGGLDRSMPRLLIALAIAFVALVTLSGLLVFAFGHPSMPSGDVQ